MPENIFSPADGLEDDFDPFAVDDSVIDQQDMEDDNPLDTVDYPTMRNMPQHMRRGAIYTPEKQGGVRTALESLFDHNPARRPVLLSIIELCEGGCASSEIIKRVDEAQADNQSVYAPLTLCRMLERAGGLELERIEASEEREDVEGGVEYLEIKETPDPVWTATSEALELAREAREGREFRDIVLNRDKRYLEVYRGVLGLLEGAPRVRTDIEELVDSYDEVQQPRRFGGHFIDMLEKTGAITWADHKWTITDLGRAMLAELPEAV